MAMGMARLLTGLSIRRPTAVRRARRLEAHATYDTRCELQTASSRLYMQDTVPYHTYCTEEGGSEPYVSSFLPTHLHPLVAWLCPSLGCFF